MRRRALAALPAAEEAAAALLAPDPCWGALREHLARLGPGQGPGTPAGEVRLSWPGEGSHALARLSGDPLLVPRAPREHLERALALHAREVFLPAEALAAGADLEERARLARTTVALGRAALEPLVRAAEARRAAWKKPRLVLEAERCLALERVPEALREELLDAPELRARWGELAGEAVPAGREAARLWAEGRPRLPVDTGRLGPALRERLLIGLGAELDRLDGLFLQGENAGALALLARRLAGRVRLCYLDPPFNTSARRGYEDGFSRAAWLGFMDERLGLVAPLLTPDGTLYAHIDGHEKERLRLLLDRHLHHVGEIVWRIGWCSGFKTKARKFVRNHDTIYHYGRGPQPLFVRQHIPYPPGYVRRDGKPPRGAGYPLEDTWNCSPLDRLDSIQIVSFSREKVGDGQLTQKPEALLLRMLEASSLPGDWVLDPFSGTGTTCAAALKSGRRFLGIEWAPRALAAALPRLERVIAGEPRGISARTGWQGGGAFARLRLEAHEDTLAALDADPAHGLAWTLEDRGPAAEPPSPGPATRLLLRWEGVPDPLACRLATPTGPGPAVDLPESLAWLLGLDARRLRRVGPVLALSGIDPAGGAVVALWAREGAADPAQLRAAAEAARSGAEAGRLFVWGRAGAEALEGWRMGWTVSRTEAALEALLQPEP